MPGVDLADGDDTSILEGWAGFEVVLRDLYDLETIRRPPR